MSLSKPVPDPLTDVYRCQYGEAVRLAPLTYHQWSQDLEFLLEGAGVLTIALGEEQAPPADQVAPLQDFRRRSGLAVSCIYNSCGVQAKAFLRSIGRDPETMWDALAAEFNTASSRSGREGLLRQFNRCSPDAYPTVSDYITALLGFQTILAPTDQSISDATFISRLTSTLPAGYKITVELLHHRPDASVSDYITAIRQQESALQVKSDVSSSNVAATLGSALISSAQGDNGHAEGDSGGHHGRGGYRGGYRGGRKLGATGTCYHCGKLGHNRRDCLSFKRQQQSTQSCFHCGRMGHVRSDCHFRKKGEEMCEEMLRSRGARVAQSVPEVTATPAIATNGSPEPYTSVQALLSTSTHTLMPSCPAWVIDSGATHHLCRDRAAFFGYCELTAPITIRMGNEATVPAVGKGMVRLYLRADGGRIFSLDLETLHVPLLRMSLLSVGKLSTRYDLSFARDTCVITNRQGVRTVLGTFDGTYWRLDEEGQVVVPGHMVNAPLSSLTTARAVSSSTTVDALSTIPEPSRTGDLDTWYRRLSHLNYRSVASITGLPFSTNLSPCQICLQAKHQRQYVWTPVEHTTRPFELIHSDLCGPISTPSCSGSYYLILYIDDYTRWAYGFFLRSKDSTEITSIFQEFQARIETSYPRWPIARFRCDNAKGEYDNSLFHGILRVSGISFEPAPPYTQHKNGVAERMIRTIVSKGRAMLLDSNLSEEMWAEALETALYLHARSPSSSLGGRSPYEMLHGEKPPIHHIRRFGCSANRLIPKEKREGKFGPRSRECILLGYVHSTSKIWRVWDPVFERVVQSSDVIFDETRTPSVGTKATGDGLKGILTEERYGTLPAEEDDLDGPGEDGKVNIPVSADRPSMRPGAGSHIEVVQAPPPNAILRDQPLREQDEGREDLDGNIELDMLPTLENYNDLPPQPALSRGLKRARDSSQMLRRSKRRRTIRWEVAAMPALVEDAPVLSEEEPTSYAAAMRLPEWRDAIKKEFESLIENETWGYVATVPRNIKPTGCKWVFKRKTNADGTIRHKARLVIKGYEQTAFGETYAPVARLSSFRTLLSLSVVLGWQVHHMDVITAFLNPKIDSDQVYMSIPEGLEWLDPDAGPNSLPGGACQLKKAIYGLKQAPRLWFKDIDTFLRSISFSPCDGEANLYYSKSKRAILLLYVDDILITAYCPEEILSIKALMCQRYKMSDLGLARQFLGIDIRQTSGHIHIQQTRFINTILHRFGMQDCNGTLTPLDGRPPTEFAPLDAASQSLYQSLVGNLMYVMLGTRPDLAFTISILSKYSTTAGPVHLSSAKRVLRYLRETSDLGITYSSGTGSSGPLLIGYTDSDWAGDLSDRKSTGGFVFLLAGGAISWRSKKQTIVALSTTEAEYIGASEAAREALWLQGLLKNLSSLTTVPLAPVPTTVYTDSTGCLVQLENTRQHERTKHVDIKYHHVQDLVERKMIDFLRCSTQDMVADVLTKPLGRWAHWKHLPTMGLATQSGRVVDLGGGTDDGQS